MRKAKKTKIVRKSLKDKLAEVHLAAVTQGRLEGEKFAKDKFRPYFGWQNGSNDFLRMVDSWGNLADDAIIMIAGTDLKAHCTGAVPVRLFRAIGTELKRLGYSPLEPTRRS